MIEEGIKIKGSLLRTAGDLSVTVCTSDADVLAEVGVLFIRLADIARKAADEFVAVGPGLATTVATATTIEKGTAVGMTEVFTQPPVVPTPEVYAGLCALSVDTEDEPAPTNVFAPNPPTPVPAPPVTATPAAPGIFLVTPAEYRNLAAATAPLVASSTHAAAELDGEGLPWDRRIHASTKTRRQSDNTWKLLKGIDPAVVESVKAEIRAAMAAICVPVATPPAIGQINDAQGVQHVVDAVYTPTSPTPVAPAPVAPPAPPAVDLDAGWPSPPAVLPHPSESPAEFAARITPGAPLPPPAPPVTTTPAMTFPMLVAAITANQQAGKITPAQVKTVCESFGLASLPLIASRPELIPQLHEALAAIWGAS